MGKTSTIAAGGTLLGTGTKVTVTEAVKGVLPTYFVTPPALAPGTTYFARVSAYNSEGWSTRAVGPGRKRRRLYGHRNQGSCSWPDCVHIPDHRLDRGYGQCGSCYGVQQP